MIVSLSGRASKAIGIVPGFCLEAEAFATGKAAPALPAHCLKALKETIAFAKSVDDILKLILKRLASQTRLMMKPCCPEFRPAAAKVTAQMSDTSALQISLLVRRIKPVLFVRVQWLPRKVLYGFPFRLYEDRFKGIEGSTGVFVVINLAAHPIRLRNALLLIEGGRICGVQVSCQFFFQVCGQLLHAFSVLTNVD